MRKVFLALVTLLYLGGLAWAMPSAPPAIPPRVIPLPGSGVCPSGYVCYDSNGNIVIGDPGTCTSGTCIDTLYANYGVVAVSSNTTLTAAQMKGSLVVLTGDGTVLTLADIDDCDVGDCIRVRVADATAKSIDTTDDADDENFELNGVDMTASYKMAVAASNQGAIATICKEVAGKEWIVDANIAFTDSEAD